jgi:hypothetical protein
VHCSKCGAEISEDANFCSKCGSLVTAGVSAVGDGSLNIAGSNNISNSQLHVGNIYNAERPADTAYIDRTFVKPITLAGNSVKTSWLIFSGLVGFVGSWASIFSFFGSVWQFLFIFILGISMFLALSGIQLRRARFSKFFWFNIEANKEGKLFLSRIGGDCPKCDGNLKLVDIKIAQDRHKTFVRCSRNSDHIWNFDPTCLD